MQGDLVEPGEQWTTIAAVLLGALTTHITTFMMERRRHRHELLTRWDHSKLNAYESYIDHVRTCIFLAVQLYEHRQDIRPSDKGEAETAADMREARRLHGRAFERVMLLGGDAVVEAAHRLNEKLAEIDWQVDEKVDGTLTDWRARHRAAFNAINQFHEVARVDLGVAGSVTGDEHPDRDLLLPATRQGTDESST